MKHTYHDTQQYQICQYSSHLADEFRPADGSRSQGVAVAGFASTRNDRLRQWRRAAAHAERVSGVGGRLAHQVWRAGNADEAAALFINLCKKSPQSGHSSRAL